MNPQDTNCRFTADELCLLLMFSPIFFHASYTALSPVPTTPTPTPMSIDMGKCSYYLIMLEGASWSKSKCWTLNIPRIHSNSHLYLFLFQVKSRPFPMHFIASDATHPIVTQWHAGSGLWKCKFCINSYIFQCLFLNASRHPFTSYLGCKPFVAQWGVNWCFPFK